MVRTYATAYEQEAQFPPIKVAQVKDGLVLIDGWHRLAAQEAIGWTEVCAEIVPVEDAREVLWLGRTGEPHARQEAQ